MNITKYDKETLKIEEFIKKVIRHVPDKQFKMIRYYGAYARIKSKKTRKVKEKSLYAMTNEKKK